MKNHLHKNQTRKSAIIEKQRISKQNDYIPNTINLFKYDKYKQTSLLEFENKYEQSEYQSSVPKQILKIIIYTLIFGNIIYIFFLSKPQTCENILFSNKKTRENLPFLQDLLKKIESNSHEQISSFGVYEIFKVIYSLILLSIPLLLRNKPEHFTHQKLKILILIFYFLFKFKIFYDFYYINCEKYEDFFNKNSENIDRELNEVNYLSKNFPFRISFSIKIFISNTIVGLFVNSILKIKLIENFIFQSLVFLFYHLYICTENNKYFFFIRIFINIFSFNFIKLLISYFFCLVFQYLSLKAITELWAIYDSFKRSYNIFKNQLDLTSMPVFIISKKTNSLGNIFYSNKSANSFYEKVSKKHENKGNDHGSSYKRSVQRQTVFQLKDLFISIEKYNDFLSKLDSIEKEKKISFLYPFYEEIKTEENEDKNGPSTPSNEKSPKKNIIPSMKHSSNRIFYEEVNTKYNPIWVNVVVYFTVFKNQEAYLINFIYDNSLNEYNIISNNMSKLLDNILILLNEVTIPIELVSNLETYMDDIQNKKSNLQTISFNPATCTGSPSQFNKNKQTPSFNASVSNNIAACSQIYTPSKEVGIKKRLNEKSISHQIINILNNNYLNYSSQNTLSEYYNIIPRSSYTLSYYFNILIKSIHIQSLSIEYIERNISRNTCLSKIIKKYKISNPDEKSSSFKFEEKKNQSQQNFNSIMDSFHENDNFIKKNTSVKQVNLKKSTLLNEQNSKNFSTLSNIGSNKVYTTNDDGSYWNNNNIELNNQCNLSDYYYKLQCKSTNIKLFFEDLIEILSPQLNKKRVLVNITQIPNEEVYLDKDASSVVFFNILNFIIKNISKSMVKTKSLKNVKFQGLKNLKEESNSKDYKEKNINIKINKEIYRELNNDHNIFVVTIKFKEGNNYLPYFDLKQYFDMIDKEIEEIKEDNEKIKIDLPVLCQKSNYIVSLIDKFKFLDLGLLSSLYLLSSNKVGDRKIKIVCEEISKSTTNLKLLNSNEEITIKFSIPYIPNYQYKEIVDIVDRKNNFTFYNNLILSKIYKFDLIKKSEKEEKEENFEIYKNQIYDEGNDEYKGEEDNLTPAEDKIKVYEPIKKLLSNESNTSKSMILSSLILKKNNIDSVISFIERISLKTKYFTEKKQVNEEKKIKIDSFKKGKSSYSIDCSDDSILKVDAYKETSKELGYIKSLSSNDDLKLSNKSIKYDRKEEKQSGTTTKKRWNLKDIKVKYFSPPRYLIVEDNYAGRSELGRMIQIDNSKHFIDLVDNGPEAIDKFSKMICQGYIYDFIFLDIEIPDINGIDVACYIREKEKIFDVHTNIAAVTGKSVSEIPPNIFDYICKHIFLIYNINK